MENKIDLWGVKHVAIIMDGNRRWAKKHGLKAERGHKEGGSALQNLVKFCSRTTLDFLTVFAFSTENWSRSPQEVKYLMSIIEDNFEKYKNEPEKTQNCKINVIGSFVGLSDRMQKIIIDVQEKTKNNTGLNLVLAFNYGGRLEIVDAVKKIATLVKNGALSVEEISEETVKKSLYTNNIPDPDLVIRTGGQKRISNFLPWQSIYSEYIFLDTFWPDFKETDFMAAIEEFYKRERHFGGG